MSEIQDAAVLADSKDSRESGHSNYRLMKRPTELLIIFLILPGWLIAMAVIALLIKLDSPREPVFFLQERTGRHGKRFRMLKFRTMVQDAGRKYEQYAHLNVRKWPEVKIPNDPRVTRIGKILRPLHLDELPQIWNVIRGEMSLVGPRPSSWQPDQLNELQKIRLSVPPGITGPWQLAQTETTYFEERAQMDVEYIRNMSLFGDVLLVGRTFWCLLSGRFNC